MRTLSICLVAHFCICTLALAQPTITSFTPSSGPVGTLVTITGTDLTSPTSLNIGGVEAVQVNNTGTSLVALVMPGATSGNVSISTGTGNALASATYSVTASLLPNTQLGLKRVGTGAVGSAGQGYSVEISADGTTAAVGGLSDDGGKGAVWFYTRVAGEWSQQGTKQVGTGAIGNAAQGFALALSADGNTAIVGARDDNANQGAAWVFTRSGGVWSEQAKLIGSGAVGTTVWQGWAVALSADGNTSFVGGNWDNGTQGAVWVFTRSGVTWSQQGGKLVGSGSVGFPAKGSSISASADGNTMIFGGYDDNSGKGAAWVYTRSASTWSQQGLKLTVTGEVGSPIAGRSIALSADGNTAALGGPFDNSNVGAVWIFVRSSGVWLQQGSKLVGTGSTGNQQQGWSVDLSADGNTLASGAWRDNTQQGATYLFTRSGTAWTQQGTKLVGTGNTGGAQQGFRVALSADGNALIVGGNADDIGKGAAWIFVNDTVSSTEADATSTRGGRLTLFPNPVSRSQRLTLALPDRVNAAAYTVEFIDLAGRVGLTQHGELAAGSSEALLLSVSTLAPGSYAVRYSSGGTSTTGRVLVTE